MRTVAGVATAWALAAGLGLGARAPRSAPQTDSLIVVARQAASAWQRHDFAALVAGSPGVMVRLGGADPSAPLPPAQAARTLEGFAGGAEEVETEVLAVREVDPSRAYAEVQRTYVARGTSARRVQMLYFGWRRVGGVPRLIEIRVMS